MPEYNPSIAATVQGSGQSFGQTINSLAQIQQSQAMVGLRDIQTLQAQRQYNALQAAAEAYKKGSDPVAGYLSAGGDPAGGAQLQNIFAAQTAMSRNGGILPQYTEQMTGADKNRAETGLAGARTKVANIEAVKTGTEALTQGAGLTARLAQGVISDPSSDDAWTNAVKTHYSTFGGPALEQQQLLAIKDPAMRTRIAKAYAAQGVSPDTFGAPHAVAPENAVTTPGASYQTGGMIGNGERIIGGGVVGGAPSPQQPNVSPSQRIQRGFGTIAPQYTPGQVKAQEGQAATDVGIRKEAQEKYNNANIAQYGLWDLQNSLDKLPTTPGKSNWFETGSGFGKRLALAKAVNTAMETAGFDPIFDKTQVAAGESANKGTTRLGFDLAKTLGSREAAMIVQQSIGVQPGTEMTEQGNRRIIPSLVVASQRDKDYFKFLKQYQSQNPNADTGDATIAFNEQHPPSQYVQDVQRLVDIAPVYSKALKENPGKAADFDAKFGAGMSRYILGK